MKMARLLKKGYFHDRQCYYNIDNIVSFKNQKKKIVGTFLK